MSPWKNAIAAETLDNLRPGFEAAVLEIRAGEGPLCKRLQELGVVPGVPVEVLSAGSPMLVRVGEARLCLRSDLANAVHVLPAA